MLAEARYFARMMAACWRLARTPIAADPRAVIAENLANREANFLELMDRTVFANEANPYNRLFRWAGCTAGDLRSAVLSNGLEPTLEQLRKSGVYLTHDEFKGNKPIERAGLKIEACPGDFANTLSRAALETTSSGSRSRGTVIRPSVEFQIYREAQDSLLLSQFGPSEKAILTVLPILPSTLGFHRMLGMRRRGTPVDKWFALGGNWRNSGHYRLLTHLLVAETQLMGLKTIHPSYIPSNDFSPVARWIARKRAEGRGVLWIGAVSIGVRVASAAIENGLNIGGTTFVCGAEPLTPARREVIESAGGVAFSRYGISEFGSVGCACPEMSRSTAVHLMRDSLAAISYRRTVPLAEMEVESLMFTTLSPVSVFVLVNVEMDDSGRLEPAKCNCALKAMGFTQQISDVYSYGKLTGQGVTLLGGDLLSVLEKSLPSRFGGTPADYQLIELDGQSGCIVELRVNPRVSVRSEQLVVEFFLNEVRRLWGGSLTARQWGQTGAVRVVFAEPVSSGGRKINALHLLGSSRPRGG